MICAFCFPSYTTAIARFSLRDVDLTDNAGNSAAAFSFLRELDERNKTKDSEATAEDREKIDKQKITFKKREKKKESEGAGADEDKVTKKKKSPAMTLSHLMDEEEEED